MDTKELAVRIAEAVQVRLGRVDATASALIAQEVAKVLSEDPTMGCSTLADPGLRQEVAPEGEIALTERVVVSANGRNKAGIVATLTQVISDFGGDIRDISQTIVGSYFTMIIVVDIAGATSHGSHFADFKARLSEVGQAAGFHVVTLHDDLLTAMHNV
jgi:ACT domain-containing protein